MKATLSKIITKYFFLLGNKQAIFVLHDQYQKTFSRSCIFFKHNWCSKEKKNKKKRGRNEKDFPWMCNLKINQAYIVVQPY